MAYFSQLHRFNSNLFLLSLVSALPALTTGLLCPQCSCKSGSPVQVTYMTYRIDLDGTGTLENDAKTPSKLDVAPVLMLGHGQSWLTVEQGVVQHDSLPSRYRSMVTACTCASKAQALHAMMHGILLERYWSHSGPNPGARL